MKITDTLANRTQLGDLDGVIGRPLRGALRLEVPVQTSPVPRAILDYADELDIEIRDVAGTVYRAATGGMS